MVVLDFLKFYDENTEFLFISMTIFAFLILSCSKKNGAYKLEELNNYILKYMLYLYVVSLPIFRLTEIWL